LKETVRAVLGKVCSTVTAAVRAGASATSECADKESCPSSTPVAKSTNADQWRAISAKTEVVPSKRRSAAWTPAVCSAVADLLTALSPGDQRC
jgi:hypothetical protein